MLAVSGPSLQKFEMCNYDIFEQNILFKKTWRDDPELVAYVFYVYCKYKQIVRE